MGIDVHRDSDVGVSQALGDHLGMHPGGEKKGSMGMAQAVKGQVRQTGLADQGAEILAYNVRRDG